MTSRALHLLRLLPLLLLAACCGPKQNTPGLESTFEKDNKGGIFFEQNHLTQRQYPDLTDVAVQGVLPESTVYFVLHYPQGVHEKADNAIRKKASAVLGALVLEISPTLAQVEEKPLASDSGNTENAAAPGDNSEIPAKLYPCMVTYGVTETGTGVFSVNFRSWCYLGGAHENWEYSALSVDVRNGETLSLFRLFKNEQSIARTARWLSAGKNASHKKPARTTDAATTETLQINVLPDDITMDRIVLTAQGLDIVFAPYEKASFALGDVTAHVPRGEFKRLGINPEFWGK